jgi:hypothetical protein
MVDVDVDWILNISIILKPTTRDSTTALADTLPTTVPKLHQEKPLSGMDIN